MARDPEQFAHQEWLGYVQPIGLVVSIPSLLHAQAHVPRNVAPEHQQFLAILPRDDADEIVPEIRDFAAFTRDVLGWEEADLVGLTNNEPIPPELEATLPGYNETLRPTYVVREFQPQDAARPWMMLVKSYPVGTQLDALLEDPNSHWQATPHAKFERLLRETQVPIGLLANGTHLRIVYAPRGETSGYATFAVADMAAVAGRPIFAALHMLLCAERLFSLPEKQRLPAILADSRKYQNVVSTQLSEQVLAALYELVRGFQSADEQRRGELLREVLAADPNHVYAGLLTVLLRLVFVLYAEDRGLISNDPVYSNYYSVSGLFERLRADAGRYPDTMDQRYGAWAQLLTLFRLIYDGGQHEGLKIPARRGYLFDPDRYNFLEGRPWKSARRHVEKAEVPRIPDGVIYRVLEKLLILDGERISYRTLDVEQIGSVYETMMGLELEVAEGPSIGLRLPKKNKGVRPPVSVNLNALLKMSGSDRLKFLKTFAEWEPSTRPAAAIKSSQTIEDLLAGLESRIHREATPNVAPQGAMVLQPSDERRRSGSHYTPRPLTEPIVRTTLEPILKQLGENPRPEQILALKVCDPAMGSGAFLVEACRQLGDALVEAWHANDALPSLPADEDELLHARRLVAQRCLYGVDKNPMAVDLSKLSLWLATLAKDHPFTFLDHSLRCGDSLVGLSREQIAAFHWKPPAKSSKGDVWFGDPIAKKMQAVTESRREILAARDEVPYDLLRQKLDYADEQLALARLAGDSVITAFFSAAKDKDRKKKLDELARQMVKYIGPESHIEDRTPLSEAVAELHSSEHPLQPFHWEIEFPEVFGALTNGSPTGGFDAIIGNPPFAGKNTIAEGSRAGIPDWLKALHAESHGNADLVAHFFRRAFNLLRPAGTFGLIATNTIAQGDTRSTGLRWICANGGVIYGARKRVRWPGQAAVVVSVVHLCRGTIMGWPVFLDGQQVQRITAYLLHSGGHDSPATLQSNQRKSFQGSIILGMGFTFDDSDSNGVANPLSLMHELIESDSNNIECIFPYIGGDETANSPTHKHHRYVINFGDMPLRRENVGVGWFEASPEQRDILFRNGIVPLDYPDRVASDSPDLLNIVENKIKGHRASHSTAHWWHFERLRKEMYDAIKGVTRLLAINCGATPWMAFTFLPPGFVYANTLTVVTLDGFDAFALLQSRVHEVWARREASSMKDDLRYTPTDCFETFPFPDVMNRVLLADGRGKLAEVHGLSESGRSYFDHRAAVMSRNSEGMTKTYNRFHDRDHDATESDRDLVDGIRMLRELHAGLDYAVLKAYGWHDLAESVNSEFLLDYEEEGEEEEATGRTRRRKKPWRYRWPDEFRDEVLARLLALNAERAEQERIAGETSAAGEKKKLGAKSAKGKKAKQDSGQQSFPGL